MHNIPVGNSIELPYAKGFGIPSDDIIHLEFGLVVFI